MRQAVFIDEALRRYSTTIFACHFCGQHFITCIWFATHLDEVHLVDDPIVHRFLERDSDTQNMRWPNR